MNGAAGMQSGSENRDVCGPTPDLIGTTRFTGSHADAKSLTAGESVPRKF
jgi:hypothetical protein